MFKYQTAIDEAEELSGLAWNDIEFGDYEAMQRWAENLVRAANYEFADPEAKRIMDLKDSLDYRV